MTYSVSYRCDNENCGEDFRVESDTYPDKINPAAISPDMTAFRVDCPHCHVFQFYVQHKKGGNKPTVVAFPKMH